MKHYFRQRILFNSVPFTVISAKELLDQLLVWHKNKQKRLVQNMNAYGVTTFLKNNKYAEWIRKSDLVYADGWGPVLASKLTNGEALPERVNVGDFIEKYLSTIPKKYGKVYLIGCEQQTVEETASVLTKKFSNLKVVGSHHGFFDKAEEKKVISQIAKTKPDLVLVGMGIPHQELFLERNWSRLPAAIYMGVGGVFYYLTQKKSRAPIWMRNYSMEWMYRLFQEPMRLGKRYTLDLLEFVWLTAIHSIKRN